MLGYFIKRLGYTKLVFLTLHWKVRNLFRR